MWVRLAPQATTTDSRGSVKADVFASTSKVLPQLVTYSMELLAPRGSSPIQSRLEISVWMVLIDEESSLLLVGCISSQPLDA